MTADKKAWFVSLVFCFLFCTPGMRYNVKYPYTVTGSFVAARYPGEPVVILSDTVALKLIREPDRNLVAYSETVEFYVNKNIPPLLKEIIVTENQGVEYAPEIRLTVLYPDGTVWQSNKRSFNAIRIIFKDFHPTSLVHHVCHIPRYTKGMLIRLKADRVYFKPEIVNRVTINNEYPMLHKNVFLSTPTDCSIRRRLCGNQSFALDTATVTRGQERVYTMHASDIVKDDDGFPDIHAQRKTAGLYTSFPPLGRNSFTWKQLGDYYLQQLDSTMRITVSCKKLALQIHDSIADSIVAKATLLLRNTIRYHADMDKFHGMVPRPVDQVITNGYGDCKEMAILLHALCAAKGVECGPALISTADFLHPVSTTPSMGGFDHMIFYFKKKNGNISFVDPTTQYGDPLLSYYPYINHKTFILKKGESRIAFITEQPDYRNSVSTASIIYTNTTGKWKIKGDVTVQGAIAFWLYKDIYFLSDWETATLLKPLLRRYLMPDIDTLVVQYRDCMRLSLYYEADFALNHIVFGGTREGLRIDAPLLFDETAASAGADTVNITRFDQQDTWVIPNQFLTLDTAGLAHCIGSGSWSKNGNTVYRRYRKKSNSIAADVKKTLLEYDSLRNKFSRAFIWR